MSTTDSNLEMILDLKGQLEGLSALVYALARTLNDEQLDQLPGEFKHQVETYRNNTMNSSPEDMKSGFEDKVTEAHSILRAPDHA